MTMSVMSMTGRGTGTATDRVARVDVELSSVNRKQLDVSIGLPRLLTSFESRVQESIQKKVSRGRVTGEIRVTWAVTGPVSTLKVNERLAHTQVNELRAVARKLKLPDDLAASVLMSLPGVITFEKEAGNPEPLWPLVEKALTAALTRLQTMRRKEGIALRQDIQTRLKTLKTLTAVIGKRAPVVSTIYRENLLKRIAAALPETDLAEDERLLKEVALFADRSDITEEQVRLDSHLKQAGALLKTGGVVGRSLEFLIQEMGREINTIGSKANDGAITRQVIAFKAELERIREQIQNIE
jgi:uncharacterized protein (TIGR00255 family)